jgi:hypothetical protein
MKLKRSYSEPRNTKAITDARHPSATLHYPHPSRSRKVAQQQASPWSNPLSYTLCPVHPCSARAKQKPLHRRPEKGPRGERNRTVLLPVCPVQGPLENAARRPPAPENRKVSEWKDTRKTEAEKQNVSRLLRRLGVQDLGANATRARHRLPADRNTGELRRRPVRAGRA